MNIFDAMKGIAARDIRWAQYEIKDGCIRMELDANGYLTKMVRSHTDDVFQRAAIQRLSPEEYQADWAVRLTDQDEREGGEDG